MTLTPLTNIIRAHLSLSNFTITELNGYENANYKIKSNAKSYILKTYPFESYIFDLVKAENAALVHLNRIDRTIHPSPISFDNGQYIEIVEIGGKKVICRVLSYLEGDFFGDIVHTHDLFRSFGRFLARLNLNLYSFKNNTISARKSQWNLQYLHYNASYLSDISDKRRRHIVKYFMDQFKTNVVPIVHTLRMSTIHNDANEWNILTQNNKVSGIIDFGDLAYTPLICELAIAIAYSCYDKKDPLAWAVILVESYHDILPITEQEISVLYYMIVGRLCTSFCNSAHNKINNPDNTYAYSSEQKALDMLHRWLAINPIYAENRFREAAQYQPIQPQPIKSKIKKRQEFISPSLSLSYDLPIDVCRSAYQYMYATDGSTYLDAYNNIPHVGHSHPCVVEAGQKQMARLNTNTRYLYDELAEYSEKLLKKFPESLNKVFFVNSGSAAADLAIRMAHTHTGHQKIMVMDQGYHGNTQLALDISPYKYNNIFGSGKKEHIIQAKLPDTYKGLYRSDDAGLRYASDAINQLIPFKSNIAAFICEPIVGCGGQVPLASEYLKELYPAIRDQGGICISDEVQTGFGRLGDVFWGYESHDVIPDIVLLGKPMGNGHPMGAVVTTQAIADSFDNGLEFFSSFGGNPVSCAIGAAVLDVIDQESLQQNANIVGDYYKNQLIQLQKEFNVIGNVRGSGLFLGIELIKNSNPNDPNTELAHYIKNEMRRRYILISTDGPFNNVIKTKPPLCFTKKNADTVVARLADILKESRTSNFF